MSRNPLTAKNMSALTFTQNAPKLSQADIDHAEAVMNVSLPIQFVEHYLHYNGGFPSKPCVLDKHTDSFVYVKVFSSLCHKRPNSDNNTIEQSYLGFQARRAIPPEYLPFSYDDGGNQFCIHLPTQKIVYILMDMGDFNKKLVHDIALSFDSFLDSLVSEDEAEEYEDGEEDD
ncbi:MAG: SMI1/KNR4 family protein [Hymenobacter sp.]|nr:MAG: SMI1/KNR4 family protein [Hymenobacter sp.]